MNAGLLLIRLALGALFLAHGTRKLVGWGGRGGLDETADFFASVGYRRSRKLATLGGGAEALGGLLLLLGFLTPLGAALIAGVMVNAVVAAHWKPTLWTDHDRSEYPLVVAYEYPLLVALVAIALAFTGPGFASADRLLGLEAFHGAVWGTIAAVVAALSSFVAIGTRGATHVVEGAEPERSP